MQIFIPNAILDGVCFDSRFSLTKYKINKYLCIYFSNKDYAHIGVYHEFDNIEILLDLVNDLSALRRYGVCAKTTYQWTVVSIYMYVCLKVFTQEKTHATKSLPYHTYC